MKRRGLTLAELLFALLIIGILTSLVLFSSDEAATTAQADNIINNFAGFRIAYSILYSERDNEINSTPPDKLKDTFTVNSLLKYINDIPEKEQYPLKFDEQGSWYIVHRVDNARLKRKLAGHAVSSRLLGSDTENPSSAKEYSNQDYVIVKLK